MWHLFQVQHANILLKDIFILHLYLVCFLFELLFYFSGHYFFIPNCQFGILHLSPEHKKGGEESSAHNPLTAIISKRSAYRLNKINSAKIFVGFVVSSSDKLTASVLFRKGILL